MPIITVPDNKKIKKLNEGFFDGLGGDDDILGGSSNDAAFSGVFADIEETETKPKVIEWLKQHAVVDYDLICTGNGIRVNVNNHVYLPNHKLVSFPKMFHWGIVAGDFNVSNNRLSSFDQFPETIGGDLIINNNYFRDFTNVPMVKGKIYGEKQRIRTIYKLNTENYRKYKDGEPILENAVYIPSLKEYGTLTGINEDAGTCNVLLYNDIAHTFKLHEVEVIDGLEYLKPLM